MCQVRSVAVALLSVALVTQAYSLDAAATVVNLDEFAVVRNGTTIFDDSFNRNTTLSGGSGTVLPSGTTFSDGTAANYRVQGSIPETTANNGQAQLNAASGILRVSPPPQIPLIQIVNGSLQTGTDPAGPQTLTPANTFSAVGLFDVAVPSVVSGAYQIYLTNNTGQSPPGRGIQLRERQTDTGPVLQFQWVDNAGHLTIISQVALTPAELAEPQLELELSHDSANSDVVTALYAFGSGNTLASFNGTLTALGSTDSSTDLFTSSLNFAIPGFEAFDPVPEPSSLAVLVIALLGLAAVHSHHRHAKPSRISGPGPGGRSSLMAWAGFPEARLCRNRAVARSPGRK